MAFNNYDQVSKNNNYNNTKKAEETTEKKEKIINKINIKPEDFVAIKSTELVTLTELTIKAKTLFQGIFEDCEGGSIEVDPSGKGIAVKMYFKDCGKEYDDSNKFRCIRPIGQNIGNSTLERLKGVGRLNNTSKKYELTPEAKEIFESFMVKRSTTKGINWNEFVGEFNNVRSGINYISVMVTGIDINKIVKKIKGNKNENGNYVDYNVVIEKPIGFASRTSDQNYLIAIERIDRNALTKFTEEKLGMYLKDNGQIPMIR